MLAFLRKLSNNQDASSLATRLRIKRFRLFREMIRPLQRPLRMIDVGGTELFWERMGFTGFEDVEIVLLNLKKYPVKHNGFISIAGDARNMKQFRDKEFDIAFSNSVIEHVGGLDDQLKMAGEMARISKHYFMQTPNKFFPLEPHFLFPFFQFLPLLLKVKLVMNFRMGWYEKVKTSDKAVEISQSIRLLTLKEVKDMFPEANIYKEKVFGLTKSFIALK